VTAQEGSLAISEAMVSWAIAKAKRDAKVRSVNCMVAVFLRSCNVEV